VKTRSLKSNLQVAYFLSFVSQLFFPIAIWLFFYSKFLDFKQIALMTAVGSIATILFEIPTGAFADIVGRKKAIVLSYLLFAVSMLLTAYSQTFIVFVLLGVASALVNALYSGSLEALVYDTLKESGREVEYDQVISRMDAIAWLGLFVGSVTGGFLFAVSYRLPFLAQALITFLASIFALKLSEPSIDSEKHKLSDFVVQNTKGFRELFHSRATTRLVIIFITIGAGYDIAASILGISQAKEYGIAPEIVGIIFAAGYIISALASHFYPMLRLVLNNKAILLVAVTALLSSFLLAQFVGVMLGAGLIILRISSSTLFRNTRSVMLNPFFSSKNRATALSTINLLTILPYALLAYFIGDYMDKSSPNSFAFLLGIGIAFSLLFTEILFWFVERSKRSIN